jgi:hypothetical protein
MRALVNKIADMCAVGTGTGQAGWACRVSHFADGQMRARYASRERCRALSEKNSSKATCTGDPALKGGYRLLAESHATLEDSDEYLEEIRSRLDWPIISALPLAPCFPLAWRCRIGTVTGSSIGAPLRSPPSAGADERHQS